MNAHAHACTHTDSHTHTHSHPHTHKLQALVYDILPSTTAVFSYTIGSSKKLSANEQFFVGTQTVVSLLQTTQITLDVCFITDHVAYTSSNRTKIIWIETELFFFLHGVDASHVYVGAWVLGCFHSLISTQTFRRAPTTTVDNCEEIKSTPSVAEPNLAEFGGRCQKAMLGAWHTHTHTVVYQGSQGNETEEKFFKKRKVFKEDLKELTEVEWHLYTECMCPSI